MDTWVDRQLPCEGAPRSFDASPPRAPLNAGFRGERPGTEVPADPGGNQWQRNGTRQTSVVEAQEGTEDEAATRAAEHGKADAEGVLEQSGDAGMQGSEEAAAWTPGSDTPNAGRRER